MSNPYLGLGARFRCLRLLDILPSVYVYRACVCAFVYVQEIAGVQHAVA